MDPTDPSRRDRDSLESDRAARLRLPGAVGGVPPPCLFRVTSHAQPTAVPGQFDCQPVGAGTAGAAEGAAVAVLAANTGTAAVTCVGPGVPVPGDFLIGRWENGRWEAEFGGGSPPTKCTRLFVSVLGCPGTLTYPVGTVVVRNGLGATVASGVNPFAWTTASAGTYTVTTTLTSPLAAARFVTTAWTDTVTIACPPNPFAAPPSGDVDITHFTAPKPGFVCACQPCGSTSDPIVAKGYPIATTLYFSCAGGSCVLTWDPLRRVWAGSFDCVAVVGACHGVYGFFDCAPRPGTTPVRVTFSCTGDRTHPFGLFFSGLFAYCASNCVWIPSGADPPCLEFGSIGGLGAAPRYSGCDLPLNLLFNSPATEPFLLGGLGGTIGCGPVPVPWAGANLVTE